ncbi:MAG TPA: radical SAM protein [Candidatus Limnocylindria bacterium]|nr:radical SAM protein [Candidatus Limnocylindria bacterium]
MRVLFYYRGIENLGVGYLMSMLKAHGHQIDLIFDPGLDDNLFLKAPHLAWMNRHEALLERAKAFRPDLIAMGVLTNLWPFARKMAEKLKEAIGAPIIVGGHHAQALPEYVLSNPHVDYVCAGEGEIALLELANRLERGEDTTTIPTIWAKKDGVIYRNELGPLENDLDKFPFPEKQLWWDYGCFKDNLEVFTGRGCPFKCTFCNIHYQREIFADKGDFLRKRSVANVMQELKENLRRYDPKFISVHDDNFTTNPHWVYEFCEAYRKEVNLPWYCFGYPTTIKPKLVQAMKAANCATIFMGVDAGDAQIRREIMERPMSDELIYRSAQLIKDAGIGLQVSCIYGNPGETPEQMFKTLEMVDKIKPTQSSSYIFYPFPKTKLYQRAVDMGYLDEEGQEKVRQGISGYHHESILKHPHKELAETLAKITPVYVRSPAFAKPIMRWIIDHRMKRLALFLYVALIPLTFPYLGIEGIKVTLRMAWRALTGRGAPRSLPAPVVTTLEAS